MIQKDLHNRLSFLRGVSPTRQTNSDAAIVSQIIDMTDLLSLEWVIALGSLTDPGFTTVVLMEHGEAANLSDAAAVPAAQLLGTIAAAQFTEANDDVVKTIGYAGTNRYVRLTITPTGNAAGNIDISVVAVGIARIRGKGGF
jgi:hypothetical protein